MLPTPHKMSDKWGVWCEVWGGGERVEYETRAEAEARRLMRDLSPSRKAQFRYSPAPLGAAGAQP
jgi:hypothetical protein